MVELFDFQAEAAAKSLAELDRSGAALCVMPTGTGKSLTGAAVAAEVVRRGGRVLILMHRGPLFEQWAGACDATGLSWAVEKAGERARKDALFGRADVVLGSKDTMKGARLDSWPAHAFSLIVADECHAAVAKTWLRVFSHFHSAKRLGLTATPERSDEESIQPVFGNVAYELPFWEAVDRKYIAAPYFRMPETRVDLSALSTSGGDLNQGELEDAISRHVEVLVNLARPYVGGRQAMAFTPRVFSAKAMADGFRQVGTSACSASGQSEDKDLVIKRFRASEFQLLASCDLLREGADFPEVSCGVLARPTKSGLVYRQMIGRLLRKRPGKEYAEVVNYAWVSGKHDLFRPVDLFDATGMDLDVLALARKLMDSGNHPDARDALKKAEEVRRRELEVQVRVREQAPKYRMIAHDPFQIGALLGIPNRQREGRRPATTATRNRLESHRIDPGSISEVQARAVLDGLDARRKGGLATHRQVACLVAQGVPQEHARAMTFEQAKGDLDIVIGRRA